MDSTKTYSYTMDRIDTQSWEDGDARARDAFRRRCRASVTETAKANGCDRVELYADDTTLMDAWFVSEAR